MRPPDARNNSALPSFRFSRIHARAQWFTPEAKAVAWCTRFQRALPNSGVVFWGCILSSYEPTQDQDTTVEGSLKKATLTREPEHGRTEARSSLRPLLLSLPLSWRLCESLRFQSLRMMAVFSGDRVADYVCCGADSVDYLRLIETVSPS